MSVHYKRYSLLTGISSIRNKIRPSVQLLPNWKATDGITTKIWQAREEESIKVVTKLCQ